MQRSFIREILDSIDDKTISFAGGLPAPEGFPVKEFEYIGQRIFKQGPSLMQYGSSWGLESLREKIAYRYSKAGFATKKEQILITSGSQQGLFLLAQHFKKRSVLTEDPSYLGALQAFMQSGVDTVPITLHRDSLDLEGFYAHFARIKTAYLIPDFQNPTAAHYSQSVREKIAQSVLKEQGVLIEDAPYSELYFDKKYPSISSYAPQNSYHLGSFSKVLAPGLRLGWIRAEQKLLEPLLRIKESIDLHSGGIAQALADGYLQNMDMFDDHLQNLRRRYKTKMECFCEHLKTQLPEFEYEKPEGGMFVYGRLPGVDTCELVKRCMEKRVVFVPGQAFYEGFNAPKDEIRFNFSHTSSEQMRQGLEVIGQILR